MNNYEADSRCHRLREQGAEYLSDEELLSIVLDGDLSEAINLVEMVGGIAGITNMTAKDLQRAGLSDDRAVAIHAALQFGLRAATRAKVYDQSIRGPEDIAALVGPELIGQRQENLVVIWMNTKNNVVGRRIVYRGTANSAAVRVSELLRDAIVENSPAIAIAHNHPSGDVTPSPDDISMTRRLVEAAQNMDIQVLDHVIIGNDPDTHHSLKRHGQGGL